MNSHRVFFLVMRTLKIYSLTYILVFYENTTSIIVLTSEKCTEVEGVGWRIMFLKE